MFTVTRRPTPHLYKIAIYDVCESGVFVGKIQMKKGGWAWVTVARGMGFETTFPRARNAIFKELERVDG